MKPSRLPDVIKNHLLLTYSVIEMHVTDQGQAPPKRQMIGVSKPDQTPKCLKSE